MKREKIVNYNLFYIFNYYLFYKFLGLFRINAKKVYQEIFFQKLFFNFKFLYKKPMYFFFKLVRTLMPSVGYRKKERFLRRGKVAVEVNKDGKLVVKKQASRKFGFKKDPNAPKEKKIKEKRGSGGRAKKGLFVLPWVCSLKKRLFISFV
jgi:hypothetical protein